MERLREIFRIATDPFERKYSTYGIRRQEMPFEPEGEEMLHTSSLWEDGEQTEDELDGVCALWLGAYKNIEEAIEASAVYYGEHVAIIASNSSEWGEDENEVILTEPFVIAIIS